MLCSFTRSILCYNNIKHVKRFSSLKKLQQKRAMGNRENIVWMDLEMTGLDPIKDRIMEIACIVTDPKLEIVAEGPDIIIHHDEAVLAGMNEWCKEHHGKVSGLTEACLKSCISMKNAEMEILNFIMKHTVSGTSPLAGNSVYMDRMFLMNYMPNLNGYMHYRIIDVSTVKELCRRWNPEVYKNAPKKIIAHRALSDIKESIKELKYYKDNAFLNDPNNTLL